MKNWSAFHKFDYFANKTVNPKEYIMLCIEKVIHWFRIIIFYIGSSYWLLFCLNGFLVFIARNFKVFIFLNMCSVRNTMLGITTFSWLILCVVFQTFIWVYNQLGLFIACPTYFGKTSGHFLLVARLIFVARLDVLQESKAKTRK